MRAEALPTATRAAESEIILASQSTARARLLDGAGVLFAAIPANIDEAAVKARHREGDGTGIDLAHALAEMKAVEISTQHPGALVIGADQVLECDGALYDKPPDRAAARRQLRALRGRSHRLVSALSVARAGAPLWRYEEVATLVMRSFSDDFLESYLDAAGPAATRSVGGYEIEGPGAQLFARIDGDYFTILGLPLLPLLEFLRGQGLVPQ